MTSRASCISALWTVPNTVSAHVTFFVRSTISVVRCTSSQIDLGNSARCHIFCLIITENLLLVFLSLLAVLLSPNPTQL